MTKSFDCNDSDICIENPKNCCLECGKDFEWFKHTCDRSNEYEEIHGCSTCDDHCDLC